MNWLIVTTLILAALIVFVAKLYLVRGAADGSLPYTLSSGLFSIAERSFLGVLDQAVGRQYRIFGKVRVADVLSIKPMRERAAWRRAFNKINAKHFDFVLCDPATLKVIAVLELDDQSHQQSRRQARDEFLTAACTAASLPLIRVPAQRSYALPEVRAALQSVLTSTTASSSGLVTEPAVAAATIADKPDAPTQAAAPTCPECSSPMALRQGKTGALAGQTFWGCSTYPRCRAVVPVQLQA